MGFTIMMLSMIILAFRPHTEVILVTYEHRT